MNKRRNSLGATILLLLIIFDFLVWHEIFSASRKNTPEVYFLDVGQGDAELLILPQGVKILTDAGRDKKIIPALAKIEVSSNKYIDVAIITHPQQDHFGGFLELLEYYNFGIFIVNGRDNPKANDWSSLIDKIKSKKIPLVVLGGGDKIKYQQNQIKILSPDKNLIQSAELNDTGLVQLIETPSFRALFASDIGESIENYLIKNNTLPKVDILKVAHHGSKYSSGINFLEFVKPKVAIIEVGEENRYGHPAEIVLNRLKSAGSQIFRTDLNGTIKISAEQNKLKVFVDKLNFEKSL